LAQVIWALGSSFEIWMAYLIIPRAGWRILVLVSALPMVITFFSAMVRINIVSSLLHMLLLGIWQSTGNPLWESDKPRSISRGLVDGPPSKNLPIPVVHHLVKYEPTETTVVFLFNWSIFPEITPRYARYLEGLYIVAFTLPIVPQEGRKFGLINPVSPIPKSSLISEQTGWLNRNHMSTCTSWMTFQQ